MQNLECKTIASDATEATGQSEKEPLPLLGQNLINRRKPVVNRSKREQPDFKYNGPLLGTF